MFWAYSFRNTGICWKSLCYQAVFPSGNKLPMNIFAPLICGRFVDRVVVADVRICLYSSASSQNIADGEDSSSSLRKRWQPATVMLINQPHSWCRRMTEQVLLILGLTDIHRQVRRTLPTEKIEAVSK